MRGGQCTEQLEVRWPVFVKGRVCKISILYRQAPEEFTGKAELPISTASACLILQYEHLYLHKIIQYPHHLVA